MIEEVDDRVRDWLTSVAGDAPISFALPEAAAQLTLFAYLFDIDRSSAAQAGRLPPLQLRLGYLVTASGPDAIAAHALLGKVISAADTDPAFTLDFGSAAAAAWAALLLPVRPGFVLRATAVKERAGALAPPVRAMRIDSVRLEPLSGRVVAKDGTPLPGAIVEASSIGRSATTDASGRFTLEGVSNALDLSLRTRAKGVEAQSVRPANSAGDYTITVDLAK